MIVCLILFLKRNEYDMASVGIITYSLSCLVPFGYAVFDVLALISPLIHGNLQKMKH